MRLSITLTGYPDDPLRHGAHLDDVAAAADAAGVDTVWVADHLVQAQPGFDVHDPMLEAFTTLGFLARGSERVRLGTMVAPATVRAPAVLVKAMTTLDVLTGGRAWLGVGAGYQQDEARAMGLDLPGEAATRFDRLEETLRIAVAMRAGRTEPHRGTHYRLEHPVNSPPPVGPLPILVGGAGERRTLRLVARYADACNVFDVPDGGATIRRKFAVLDRHCADLGRDPADLDRSVSTFWRDGTPVAELAEHCAALSSCGATHVVLLRPAPWQPDAVAALADCTTHLDTLP